MPEVEAAAGTDAVCRERHHRRELLRRQDVVVAGRGAALTWQAGDEEPELLAQRSMEPHLAKRPPDGFDAAVELRGIPRRDGHRENGAQ